MWVDKGEGRIKEGFEIFFIFWFDYLIFVNWIMIGLFENIMM